MGLTLKMFKAGDCHLVCDDGHMFFFHLSETCNGSFFFPESGREGFLQKKRCH